MTATDTVGVEWAWESARRGGCGASDDQALGRARAPRPEHPLNDGFCVRPSGEQMAGQGTHRDASARLVRAAVVVSRRCVWSRRGSPLDVWVGRRESWPADALQLCGCEGGGRREPRRDKNLPRRDRTKEPKQRT